MDVEWAHALAPGANILLVEAYSPAAIDLFLMVNYARQQPGVSVVSMSWGFDEVAGDATSYDQNLTTPANHIGMTFVAATGDKGAQARQQYPAASPNVLAVGGTSLTTDAQGNYGSESAWPQGGGGLSQYEPQPASQKGVPALQGTTFRATPDVSFDAGGLVSVYDSYDFGASTPWTSNGGTSLLTPAWAALVAIADQGTTLLGQGTLTGVTTAKQLYQLGGQSIGFHDITTGSDGNAAGPGYDLATGLGTPMAESLAEELSGNIGTPVPQSPSGVVTGTLSPIFSWSPVPGATKYHLVVTIPSPYPNSITTVLDTIVSGATSYTPTSNLLGSGNEYAWSVQAETAVGVAGAPSNPVDFSFPAAMTPAIILPGYFLYSTTPTLSWTAVPAQVHIMSS